MIDDTYIRDLMFGNRQLKAKVYKEVTSDKDSAIYKYIDSRFDDSKSFDESLYRIFHGISARPKCKTCGTDLKFFKSTKKSVFPTYCSCKCAQDDSELRHKIEQTSLERYGATNVAKSRHFKEAYAKHLREKYNDSTMTNAWQAQEVKDKIRKTCLEKYNTTNYGATREHQEKLKSKEVVSKRESTKRARHTFNTSSQEMKSLSLIKDHFSDVVCQYKSDKYPFMCDFYIPSTDTYIECNYHWTHGKHAFIGDGDDMAIVSMWESRGTKFYKNAIDCWTRRDVAKRRVAQENNLNYLEFWTIDELANWLNSCK